MTHFLAPRGRQYVIGTRRCRQRLAQLLGAGRTPAEVAAVARMAETELRVLLDDLTFQELVDHYSETATLPPEERVAALHRMALDLIQLALAVGDVRAAAFVAYEKLRERDPGMTISQAAARAVEREPRPAPAAPYGSGQAAGATAPREGFPLLRRHAARREPG